MHAPQTRTALLSAPPKSQRRTALLSAARARGKRTALLIAEIDRRRRAAGVSVRKLCAVAGVGREQWYDAMGGIARTRKGTIARLAAALEMIAAHRTPVARDVVSSLTATAYRTFFNAACLRLRVNPEAAREALDLPGERAADATWRKASRARAIALHLVNTANGVRQSDLARLTGLTPAAISIAIARISDEREGRFETMLDKIERDVTGKST
jgi:hypothetical protein